MMIRRLTTGLAMAVLFGLSSSALMQGASSQNSRDRGSQYGGSLDPRQHGYEHGYRDGADQGRQDRERRLDYNISDNDYQRGAREYEGVFGERGRYMTGYRDGYKAGYDDGFNDRNGQYGQLYGHPADGNRAPARDDTYAARSWSSAHTAFDVGYRDGVTAGRQDNERNLRSDFRDTDAYRQADLGYGANHGERDAYRLQYRDGFERGYQDGYGRSRYSSDGGGYFPTRGGTGAVDTRDGQGVQTRSFTVPGNRAWTPTGIRVTQGDLLRFESTGEIRFSPNANDRAVTAGSLDHKYVSGAPLPRAFAGALIGRIDNGQPFGIGDQTSLSMPASGLLYLGINDDNVSDNSGQFQVVISW
jgi:hypothetical protein